MPPVAISGYPNGVVPAANASANVANASAAATLTGVGGKTAYMTNLQITAGGATAANIVVATITGLLGGTMNLVFAIPAGVTAGATPLILNIPNGIPASGQNTNIVATLPALGAGNTNAAVSLQGFLA